jgi:type VI protein secretion system component VasF
MSDPQIDPAGNTQQFRAFAQQREQEAAAASRKRPSYLVPVSVGVALVVIAAVAAYFLLS